MTVEQLSELVKTLPAKAQVVIREGETYRIVESISVPEDKLVNPASGTINKTGDKVECELVQVAVIE